VTRRQDAETVAIQEYQRKNVAQTTAAGTTPFPMSSGASLEDTVSHLTYTNTVNSVSFVHIPQQVNVCPQFNQSKILFETEIKLPLVVVVGATS